MNNKKRKVSAKSMANLKPLGSDERSRLLQRAGGAANAKRLADLKTMRKCAVALRDEPSLDPNFKGMSNGMAAVASMFLQAQNGNVSAFNAIATLLGEMQTKLSVELPILRDDVPRQPDPPRAV